jgi:hypothetical protein
MTGNPMTGNPMTRNCPPVPGPTQEGNHDHDHAVHLVPDG